MPRGDGTGPLGAGPMTGRGAGRCAGRNAPGYATPVAGRGARGLGLGCGAGRGRRHWYRATGLPGWMRFGWETQAAPAASPDLVEREMLEGRAAVLQQQLDAIRKRLDSLGADEGAENS